MKSIALYGASASAASAFVLLAACASVPNRPPPNPAEVMAAFAARRLTDLAPGTPAPSAGWNLAQWFDAALQRNPQLAEARAHVVAVAAAERTAAQRPNPTMELFGEYVGNAARGAAWLYGVSLDFLIRRPGDRARARRYAQVQTVLAQADLAESIWRVRATLRQALLDAASARDEAALLDALIVKRQALLVATRAQAEVGEVAWTETLAIEVELSRVKQRLSHAQARRADAEARLAAAVGLPVAALDGIPVQWEGWADIGALAASPPSDWRGEALIGRPEIVRAVHEYDLADSALRGEVAKRWPDLHITPGYAWGRDGVRENPLNDLVRQNALSVTFEAPVFNFHEGPIGEALARREVAGQHLTAVQAELYGQIDRAERAWPGARRAWEHAAGAVTVAERRREADERSLAAGAADRNSVFSAGVAATEAQLTLLEAACEAELAFGALEDAYRRPLSRPASAPPLGASPRG